MGYEPPHVRLLQSGALKGGAGRICTPLSVGLYRVLGELTSRFSDVLFEGCASGGNRFDLGMLCYMPQLWVSDCTDAVARAKIQNGCSFGYPQSVMGAHVSSCPNHQTLRVTPLYSRFAVACGGILGYECNLCDLSKEELKKIREEVSFYKKWRRVLQFGEFYRLHGLSQEESGTPMSYGGTL